MRAATSLLAALLMLSCRSFAQTAPAQQAEPTQRAATTQPTAQNQQAVAESSKPEVAMPEVPSEGSTPSPSTASPSPTASTPSTEAAASAGDVLAFPVTPAFGPGAKLYIQPMNGFEERLAYSLTKKKVPVVLESDREKADFVLTGGAHVHKRGFFTGMALSTNGKGSVWVEDARTGKQLWVYKFTRVDANTTVDEIYQFWADICANHLKKAMEKK